MQVLKFSVTQYKIEIIIEDTHSVIVKTKWINTYKALRTVPGTTTLLYVLVIVAAVTKENN